MKSRVISLMLIVVILLGLVPAASAQGGENFMTCFNLAEADCQILLAAMKNSENMKSFMLDFSFDLGLAGLDSVGAMFGESVGGGNISMNVEGSGPLMEVDSEAFPPIAMQLDLGVAFDDGTAPENIETSVIVLDGVVYALNPDTGEWEGALFSDIIESDPTVAGLLGGLMGGEGGLPTGELSPSDLAATSPEALLEAVGLGEDAMALVQIPGFINHVRLADEDMMGQTMNVFELTVDSGPLFASAEFQAVLSELITAASAEDPDMASMTMFIPMLLSGASVKYTQTQWVGAEDQFTHGLTMDISASLDLSSLIPPSEGSSEITMSPITLDITIDVQMSQINEAFEISAPEGATME